MRPPSYADTFFAGHQDGSARSAAVIVPLVLRQFPVQSAVDVGCGVGAWLAEFERHGVGDYLGIDGPYVPRSMLKIPPERFRSADLAVLEPPGRRFDLGCSLEVAEHLPADCGKVPAQLSPAGSSYELDRIDPELWPARCAQAMPAKKKTLRRLFGSPGK